MASKSLVWRVNTPALFQEVVGNPNTAILLRPFQLMGNLLALTARRAAELNDAELNGLMCQLALYEASDPYGKAYNEKLTDRTIAKGLRASSHNRTEGKPARGE